jgi:DNA-binding response OmpR family regulator
MTTILLVEDDSVLLETLSYNFERAGFQVATASDGLTGLEMARRTHPDLIIELLARVRAILRWNERQRQTPSSNVLNWIATAGASGTRTARSNSRTKSSIYSPA